jgi:hypothetical protein
MDPNSINAELVRDPFVPLRVYLANGKSFDIPFREVAHLLGESLLILKGLKQGTHQAKGYDVFNVDQILRIETRPSAKSGRRRKAS